LLPQNVDGIENLLNEPTDPDDRVAISLVPPTTPIIGLELSQAQFAITWAQRLRHPTFILQDGSLAPSTLLTPVEIAAVRNSTALYAGSSQEEQRGEIAAIASRSIDAYISKIEESIVSDSFTVMVPDYTTQRSPRLLYRSDGQVKPSETFYVILSKTIAHAGQAIGLGAINLLEQHRRAIADIVFELFQNTHDWARTNFDGTRISRSIRIIHIRMYPNDATPPNGCIPLLSQYIKRRHSTCRGFLEISILDAGPGMAQRLTERPISTIPSLDEEYGIVKRCLTLHETSTGDSRRGVGLHAVLRAIDATGGFFRLRTGRLSLCRDLEINPYIEAGGGLIAQSRAKPWLMDSATNKLKWTANSFISGSLFTTIIPIDPVAK
jgi:hypothetical protein